jgi:hypothetical protein
LSSLVNYRRTGSIVIAGYAWYRFGQAVRKGNLLGSTAWGTAAVEATVGVFIPNPVATAIGGAAVKGGRGIYAAWIWTLRLMMRYPAMSLGIVYIALLPFGIKERQELKAERGLVEPIGRMSFQAESVPNTERLKYPSIVGSRVL